VTKVTRTKIIKMACPIGVTSPAVSPARSIGNSHGLPVPRQTEGVAAPREHSLRHGDKSWPLPPPRTVIEDMVLDVGEGLVLNLSAFLRPGKSPWEPAVQ
jgi:hypothetical protein